MLTVPIASCHGSYRPLEQEPLGFWRPAIATAPGLTAQLGKGSATALSQVGFPLRPEWGCRMSPSFWGWGLSIKHQRVLIQGAAALGCGSFGAQ